MKLKEGYILREVGSLKIIVAVGEAAKDFHKILTLNQTGAFLYNLISVGKSECEMVEALKEKYEVDNDTAQKDVSAFIKQLQSSGLIDN